MYLERVIQNLIETKEFSDRSAAELLDKGLYGELGVVAATGVIINEAIEKCKLIQDARASVSVSSHTLHDKVDISNQDINTKPIRSTNNRRSTRGSKNGHSAKQSANSNNKNKTDSKDKEISIEGIEEQSVLRTSVLKNKRKAIDKYPLFHFERDSVIKTGWSKQKKEEYAQKAPKSAIYDFVYKVETYRKSNKLFSMDMVLPIKNSKNDEDYPSYQPYLVLAYLLYDQYIKKHGREGYEVTNQYDSAESYISKLKESFNND